MDRKLAHIKMALDSQTGNDLQDRRFVYEPMLAGHPGNITHSFSFLGREMRAPIWISSMTGGTNISETINRNIARACRELGLGMGLGSCRKILFDKTYWNDFDVRAEIGTDRPLWANLGIAQVEKLLKTKNEKAIEDMVGELRADGLIIHVNPLQEWFQPEGDNIENAPIDTISRCISVLKVPLIVKEVGQGMGSGSLRALLQMPLAAMELAAFGGTNFSLLELGRDSRLSAEFYKPFIKVGHTATQMVRIINNLAEEHEPECKQLIISGGIKNYLDGFYNVSLSNLPSVYGIASTALKYAMEGYAPLKSFLEGQIRAYRLAEAYLRINPDYNEE